VTAHAQSLEDETPAARITSVDVAGVTFVADLSGALFWEEQNLLVVSDLHLEKSSSFAARGVLLPPYDTAATLGRLAAVIARHDPRMVIALGDSFHDRDAHERLSAPDRDAIASLQAAFAKIFQTPGFMAHVLGDHRLHTIAASRCY
jgi:metallophosphoesterase superfamily enzyme